MLGSTIKKLLVSLVILSLYGCGTAIESESSNIVSSLTSRAPAAPSVSVVSKNGNFDLNWNDTDAYQYRVLYWQGSDAPQEHLTNATSYILPPLRRGEYTALVEAYDALGNSAFSQPVLMEVI